MAAYEAVRKFETMAVSQHPEHQRRRILLLGATGTIGQAAARALVRRGHEVVCLIRTRAGGKRNRSPDEIRALLPGATVRAGDPADPASLDKDGFAGERFDTLASCMASRTGTPKDAWAIDYQAHSDALGVAIGKGVRQMVLLSAICVQRPKLAFQRAKLAFEKELIESGLSYSIVRPTAYFKSLSGQIERVKKGKPYLLFGDGRLTSCKPISDADLGDYIARCVVDVEMQNKILPIGGPGPAITPREQGEILFSLLGRAPKFRSVPPELLIGVAAALDAAGAVIPALKAKAAYARIGHYYATESMLVLDPETDQYSAELTPETGSDMLLRHYETLIRG